jgi:hypothetical protein
MYIDELHFLESHRNMRYNGNGITRSYHAFIKELSSSHLTLRIDGNNMRKGALL